MKSSEVSFYITSSDEMENIEKEYYLGVCPPNKELIIKLQVWNNRFGQENAKDIENAHLSITFSSIEDTKLLEYMQVKIDNNIYQTPEIINSVGIVPIERIISGQNNTGDETNTNNYITVFIKIMLNPNMKNGLKNLLISLDY